MAPPKHRPPTPGIRREAGSHSATAPSNAPGISSPQETKPQTGLLAGDESADATSHGQALATTCVSRSIEARAPLWTVYDTWTRFEAFPHFMKGMNDTHGLLNESRMVWRIRTGDRHVPLEAEVCVQIPFQKIAWRSTAGHPHPNSGEVVFDAIDEQVTHISAHLDFSSSGVHDWPGDPVPAVTQCLDWSLQCFCNVVESHVDPQCESFACPGAAVA